MKTYFITSSVLPIIGTIVTAVQLTKDFRTSIIFLVLAVVGVFIILHTDKQKDRITGIIGWICVAIMALSAVSGIVFNCVKETRNELWTRYLKDHRNLELEELVRNTNSKDGSSLMRLSDYYYTRNDFIHARTYAQKAADLGSINGYERLIRMDFNGYGGSVNLENAFENMKKAQRISDICFLADDQFRSRFSNLDLSILEDTGRNRERIWEIYEDIRLAVKEGERLAAEDRLAHYHDELVSLSLQDYLPATELLFMEAWFWGRDSLCLDYAGRLFRAGRTPTSPIVRHSFLSYLGKVKKEYFVSDYKEHIANNHYLLAVTYDENRPDGYLDGFSDSLLVQGYQLLRAQYRWYVGLNNGEMEPVDYLIMAGPDYPALKEISKIQLQQSIAAIKKRACHLGEKYTTDQYSISNFETVFQR